MSTFSPTYLTTLILEPLKYLFSQYAPEDLRWSADYEDSKIEIASINDFNKEKTQYKPRILISRGGYTRVPMGISDSLSSGESVYTTKGLKDSIFKHHLSGNIQVLIEARSEGTTEKLTELVDHFLAWSAPIICDTQYFLTFGKNMSISPCTPSREDVEIFQVSIDIPWMKEESWSVKTDGVKLKQFFLTLT